MAAPPRRRSTSTRAWLASVILLAAPAELDELLGALRSEEAADRLAAVRTLDEEQPVDPRVIAGLAGALEDEAAEVRRAAAGTLRGITHLYRDELFLKTIPPLVKLVADPDPKVRLAALDCLAVVGRSGGYGWPNTMAASKALPAILESSKSEDARMRAAAVHALATVAYWTPPAQARTVEALGDPSPLVRRTAAGSLRRMRGKGLAELRGLLDDEDFGVRETAAHNLWWRTRDPEGVVSVLIEALRRHEGNEKAGALRAIEEIGPPAEAALPEVVAAFGQLGMERFFAHGDEAVRAFHAIGPPAEQALPLLREALASPELAVRLEAIAAMPAVDPPDADLLRKACEDPELRSAALLSLARIGHVTPEFVKDMGTRLSSEHQWERFDALRHVAVAGPPAAVLAPAVAKRIGDPLESEWALGALENIGSAAKECAPAVEAFLRSEHPHTRLSVSRVLWRLTGEADEVVPVLRALLGEERLRDAAAMLLAEIGPAARAALPDLEPHLKSEDTSMRIAATVAVARITGEHGAALALCTKYAPNGFDGAVRGLGLLGAGAKDAVPVLMRVARSRQNRLFAIEALGRIGPAAKDAVPLLRELRRRYDLRWTADAALASIERQESPQKRRNAEPD